MASIRPDRSKYLEQGCMPTSAPSLLPKRVSLLAVLQLQEPVPCDTQPDIYGAGTEYTKV